MGTTREPVVSSAVGDILRLRLRYSSMILRAYGSARYADFIFIQHRRLSAPILQSCARVQPITVLHQLRLMAKPEWLSA